MSEGRYFYSHLAGLGFDASSSETIRSADQQFSSYIEDLSYSYLALRCSAFRSLHTVNTNRFSFTDDNYSVKEMLFEELAVHFIVTAKASLDIAACLIKALQDGKIRPDSSLTNIFQEKNDPIIESIVKQDWLIELKKIRDHVVHHGYRITLKWNTGIGWSACRRIWLHDASGDIPIDIDGIKNGYCKLTSEWEEETSKDLRNSSAFLRNFSPIPTNSPAKLDWFAYNLIHASFRFD